MSNIKVACRRRRSKVSGNIFKSSQVSLNISKNTSVTTQKSFHETRLFNQSAIDEAAKEREREREEFYATYDVMTGVRIAATLGCFFALMVFMVVHKSKKKSRSVLDDPDIAATAAAVLEEEEEREIQEVWEATRRVLEEEDINLDLTSSDTIFRPRMMSLGNISAPSVLNRASRFSSIYGGYSSLSKSPRRYSTASYIGASYLLNELRYKKREIITAPLKHMITYRNTDNRGDFNPYHSKQECSCKNLSSQSDGDEADDEFEQITVTADINIQHQCLLSIPKEEESRRNSGVTCCSTESSFLERQFSAMSLGINSLPSCSQYSSRRASCRRSYNSDLESGRKLQCAENDDIIIAPKDPELLERCGANIANKIANDDFDIIYAYPEEGAPERTSKAQKRMRSGRAPLASLSSFRLSSAECDDSYDCPNSEPDLVFNETEEKMDQLSINSDQAIASKHYFCSPRKSILKNSANNNCNIDTCICDSIISMAGSSDCKINEVVICKGESETVLYLKEKKQKSIKPNIFSRFIHAFETKAIIEKQEGIEPTSHCNKSYVSSKVTCETRTGNQSNNVLDILNDDISNSNSCGSRHCCISSNSSSNSDSSSSSSGRSSSSSSSSSRSSSRSSSNTGSQVKIETQQYLTGRLVNAAYAVKDLCPVVALELPELAAKSKKKEREDNQMEERECPKQVSRETLF